MHPVGIIIYRCEILVVQIFEYEQEIRPINTGNPACTNQTTVVIVMKHPCRKACTVLLLSKHI